MEIIFTLKNNSTTQQDCNVMDALRNAMPTEWNNGLPAEVDIDVEIINDSKQKQEVSFLRFLLQIMNQPISVNIIKTTNNRALQFFTQNALLPNQIPLEPRFYKNKESRQRTSMDSEGISQYVTAWDRSWNIADTREEFMLDGYVIFKLTLMPKQKFEIILKVSNDPKIKPVGMFNFNDK